MCWAHSRPATDQTGRGPVAFGEIMDLTDAQSERLFQAYEIAKGLLRELKIFPGEGRERDILDIDEFDRSWPTMKLDDLRYLVSAIISIGEKSGEGEPPFRESQFYGKWNTARRRILPHFNSGDSDAEAKKTKINSPIGWKALMAKLSRLQRLRIFDRGRDRAIEYDDEGAVAVAELLLAHGADASVRNTAGLTPLKSPRRAVSRRRPTCSIPVRGREDGRTT
jgi:hypothetical protein